MAHPTLPELEGRFLRDLADIVGRDSLLTRDEDLLVYECDSLTLEKHPPQAVVLPRTPDQVSAVVRLCIDHGVPYVARGAGTGISGGADPVKGGVVLHLSRLNRILEVDADNFHALVEPGVVNTDLSKAVQKHGLYFAPDPSSQTVSTIGGNAAENAGGPHCFKYGVTVDHVLGMEVVLPTGETVRIGGPECGIPGYDLTALEVGAEGTLGIATRILVRLTPLPEMVRVLVATFPSLESAALTVTEIVSSSVVPSAIEMMDQETIKVIESSMYRAGFPTNAAAVLLLELDGFKAGVVADTVTVTKLCEKNGALSVIQGDDPDQRKKLWAARKATFGIMGKVNTDLYVLDGCVPRSRLPVALQKIQEIGARHDLYFTSVFHAGDGNLHPLVAYDGRNEDETRRVLAAGSEIMKLCLELGGTLSGEHGIGIDKKRYMPLLFSDDDLDLMRRIKSALDPQDLCNPGKLVPEASEPAQRNGSAPSEVIAPTRVTTDHDLHAALIEICGEGALDLDVASWTIDGKAPRAVVTPATEEDVARVLALASANELSVAPLGGGTHRHIGNPPRRLDLVVRTTKLDAFTTYEPADQVLTVQAGATVAAVKAKAIAHLQWLPLNPPAVEGATIGGLLAAGLPGPSRGSIGSLRDMVVGARMALSSGKRVKSGGAVIKNVTGYDLHRLQVGSLGTLGILLEVSLRLQALPPAIRSCLASFTTLEAACAFSHALRQHPLHPLALEITNSPARESVGIRLSENLEGGDFAVAARFGETEQAVSWQVMEATKLGIRHSNVGLRVAEGAGEVQLWERMIRYLGSDDKVRLRFGSLPMTAGSLAATVLSHHRDAAIFLRPASGELVVEVAAKDDDEAIRRIEFLRALARETKSTFLVERAPVSVKARIDCLEAPIEGHFLMRRLKDVFDPSGTLNPGRFAGRI